MHVFVFPYGIKNVQSYNFLFMKNEISFFLSCNSIVHQLYITCKHINGNVSIGSFLRSQILRIQLRSCYRETDGEFEQ
jgi:hypothetical protein